MKIKSPILMVLAAVVIGFSGACDHSKAELEKTQKELKAVTTERDDLKAKLGKVTGQVDGLQTEAADLREKLAAANAPKAAEPKAEGKKGKKAAARHKKKSKKTKK